MSDSGDELDIGRRDYDRVMEIHSKEGFKEGVSDGRDTEFQPGFDLGFTDGLRNGFAAGQLMALKELNPNAVPSDVKIHCECCKSGVEETSLDRVSAIHREATHLLQTQFQSSSALNKPTNTA